MILALIGPSGAGKGTQAEKVETKFGLVHVATGNLFRENLEKRTELGLLAKKYMDQGELVPDEIMNGMLEYRLRQIDLEGGVILDGFPRTLYQAQMLDELLADLGYGLETVIYLKVSDQEITTNRVPGRLTCRDCQRPYHERYKPPRESFVCDVCGGNLYRRNDDTPQRTRARLRVFHRQSAPVIDYYQEAGKLIIIDGEAGIDQVNFAINEMIEALIKRAELRATRQEAEQIQALSEVPQALTPDEATHRSLDIVLLGAPGSGKGTQAEHLRKRLRLQHVATGDLFRENLKNETELGQLARTFMNRGELVPDDVTEAMVRERLSQPDISDGFILDGFPRTLSQAEALTDIMNELNRRIDGVIYIKVSDKEIVKRLSRRMVCRECQTPFHENYKPFETCPYHRCQGEHLYKRDDDTPETVRARLRTYHGETAPLIDYYRDAGLLIQVDGEGTIAEVTERTLAAVQSLMNHPR